MLSIQSSSYGVSAMVSILQPSSSQHVLPVTPVKKTSAVAVADSGQKQSVSNDVSEYLALGQASGPSAAGGRPTGGPPPGGPPPGGAGGKAGSVDEADTALTLLSSDETEETDETDSTDTEGSASTALALLATVGTSETVGDIDAVSDGDADDDSAVQASASGSYAIRFDDAGTYQPAVSF